MARPVKNNCEYFSHDAGMRDHRKVKAIRSKYANGYAIWAMLLEYMTAADGNEFEYTDLEIQLMSGDFGFPPEEIKGVIEYCLQLEMLFEKNGFIYSESLNERLEPVYKKRGKARETSRKQSRSNGKYVTETTVEPELLISETPQSKVKESKQKEIKEEAKASVGTIVPPVEVDSIKKDWDKCPKDKREVINFILMRKPQFIEPYITMWNIWAKENDKSLVSKVTKFRKDKFRARIKEQGFDFITMLAKAKKSTLCLEKQWFTFDFLIQNEKGYVRLLEGNYDNEKQQKVNTEQPNGLNDKLEKIFGAKN